MTTEAWQAGGDDAVFAVARDLARSGSWRLDCATDALLWSEEAFRIHGCDPEQGQPTLETALAFYPPEVRRRLRRGLREVLETERELSLRAVLTGRDGIRRDVLHRFRADWCGATGSRVIWGCILDLSDAGTPDARLRRERPETRAETDYWLLFENSVTGIYRTSIDGRQIRANPALVRMNGYGTEAELLAAMRDLASEWYVDPTRRAEFRRLMLEHGRVDDFVSEVYRHRTGERIWVSETAWLIRDASGLPVAFEGTVVEAPARIRAEAEARHMARHDGLTGLANRLCFNERLEAELERRAETGTTLAVLCIDLDRFKSVNDMLGHAAGDGVLRVLAGRFRALLPRGATAARLGGDEFAVIVPEISAEADAVAFAERLLEAMHQPVDIEGRPVAVGVSVGIALAPRDGTAATALLRAADMALFAAKGQGRRAWRVFSPGTGAAEQARRGLEIALRGALLREEFTLLYQPVVRLPERRPAGYEALLRWTHPEHGPVSPEAFIPVAEQTRLIVALGEWVLERACRDAARWPSGASVAVNVSPRQFVEPGFAECVASILDRTGLAPDRLVLELTETALLDMPSDLGRLLQPLRARGLRLALDDFGTGYSAWSYLRSGLFDIVKIDASFPARLHEPGTATILATLLDLARRLGIETVVEGIETEAQLDHVAAEGCRLVQGHLTGAARPAADLAPER